AGFLELERGLQGGGEGQAAGGDHHAVLVRKAFDDRVQGARRGDQLLPGLGHPQQVVPVHVGAEPERQHGQRGERGRVGLGRGDRLLFAGDGAPGQVGGGGERTVRAAVGDAYGDGPAVFGPGQGLHDLLGTARLRYPDGQHAFEVEFAAVGGGDGGGGEPGQPPGVRFHQVPAVDCRVVGGATRD